MAGMLRFTLGKNSIKCIPNCEPDPVTTLYLTNMSHCLKRKKNEICHSDIHLNYQEFIGLNKNKEIILKKRYIILVLIKIFDARCKKLNFMCWKHGLKK